MRDEASNPSKPKSRRRATLDITKRVYINNRHDITQSAYFPYLFNEESGRFQGIA